MKVFAFENNYKELSNNPNIGWFLIADSAVTNTGKPFYLPENVGRTMVSLTIAIRISRLGKCIEPKFSTRYYSEYAPALHFMLPDYGNQLRAEGFSMDAAHNFDKSLFVGDFKPLEEISNLELKINDNTETEFCIDSLVYPLENLISVVSRMNTLKMGDLLLPGLSRKIELKEGDLLEVVTGEEKAFQVRVK